MNRFVISLGSNSSDRYEKMNMTIERLNLLLNIESASSVYETLPWGGGDKSYINCVMAGTTAMDKECLIEMAKNWEKQCGRDEEAKKQGIVPIDLDIVIWNDIVLRPKELNRDYFTTGYRQLIRATNVPHL